MALSESAAAVPDENITAMVPSSRVRQRVDSVDVFHGDSPACRYVYYNENACMACEIIHKSGVSAMRQMLYNRL